MVGLLILLARINIISFNNNHRLSHCYWRLYLKLCKQLFFLFCVFIASTSVASAQVKRSFYNLGFEDPALVTPGCRVYIADSQVFGWSTTHPAQATENVGGCVVPPGFNQTAPIIEIWRTPRNNGSGGEVRAPEGVQIAELNAAVASRLYQNVCLINNEVVKWQFSHRGRGSATTYDIANFGTALGTAVQVATTNTGAFLPPVVTLGTVNPPQNIPGNTTWVKYSGQLNYPGVTGSSNIGFEAVGGTTSGNLLDEIQLDLAPLVEFTQATSSTSESSTSNLPTFRVNGTVSAAFVVTVKITGGTATLGTDYTTPSNSDTITVNVPAGNYDGVSASSLFSLPITIINDVDGESSETILLQLQPSGSQSYQIMSSAVCGDVGQSTWEYTIIDDDQALTIIKNVGALVAVSGQTTQYDVPYQINVTNPGLTSITYGLTDLPGLDSDVSILSASFTQNGSASTPLSGSGPWVLQAQGRTLAAGATDTYSLTIRININRGSNSQTVNDTCASPSVSGYGLFNISTAELQGINGNPNANFSANACTNTPTPVWVRLNKLLVRRLAATDQVQIRILSAGVVTNTAITSGSTNPSTASTNFVAFPAGNTMRFSEAVRANGVGNDISAASYQPTISCTNVGTTFVGLPSGAGTSSGTNTLWTEFTPPAGADIDCTITNSPLSADLRITKTNNVTTLASGQTTTYSIVVSNAGSDSVSNAIVTDPIATGLTCTTASCSASGGATCPLQTGAALVTALQSAGGATVPLLPNGGSVSISLTCTVTAAGF